MNIQFVTGVYGLLTYLTAYLCKPEKTMSELMKKASKEAGGQDIRGKLKSIGNVFLTKREVGLHEATKRLLSGPCRRSNNLTLYIPTGPQKDRVRMLKPRPVLDTLDDDDTNRLFDYYEEDCSVRSDSPWFRERIDIRWKLNDRSVKNTFFSSDFAP